MPLTQEPRATDSALYPVIADLGYGTYTREEAREKWGKYFGVLNAPEQE